MRYPTRGTITIVAFLAPGVGQAARGNSTIAITFDESQLKSDNNDPILNYYDGGMTHLGVGPGPNYGVTFTLNARLITSTSGLIGTFTPPGIMELYSDTAREGEGIQTTMNVAGGFGYQVAFDYADIDSTGEMKVYSGAKGTGTVLADVMLKPTSGQTGPGTFVPNTVNFSGVANSIVFDGGNKQLAFDDIYLTSVPEPSAWSLLALGSVLFGATLHLRRMQKPSMSPDPA